MKIAIIGAGNMGGALARGLAKGSMADVSDITVSNPHRDKLEALKGEFPELNVTCGNSRATRGADVVILAVKPWKIQEVIDEIKGGLDYDRQTVASVAGGVGTARLRGYLDRGDGKCPAVYYMIPNMAVAVMSGMTFMASACSTPETDARMLATFKEMGDAMLVEERLMGAGMALASCGVAFAMRYVRAATEGGVELGFCARDAQRAVVQTMRGVAALLAGGSHPEAEIDKVTTPGGLTIRGLNAMEEAGFTPSVVAGLRASAKG